MPNNPELLPEKVKIGGYIYNVTLSEDPIVNNNKVCFATIAYTGGEIEVLDEISQEAKWQALFHEVLHGIGFDRNIDILLNDENLVDALASGLAALCKDNNIKWEGLNE